jgi:hemerythrin-like domain-containing protein
MPKAQPAGYSREAWEAVTGSMPDIDRDQHPVLAALYAEHRYMGTLLKLLSEQLETLEKGDDVDAHILFEVLHYMTHYPDAFHHPREDLVYQRAGELDPSIVDSVDTLQREHDHLAVLGAQALEAVAKWRDGDARSSTVVTGGWDYVGAMYRHMSAEEKLVFPQIRDILGPADWLELEQEDLLAPVNDPVFGPKVSREYRKLARSARRVLHRGVEDAAVAEWVGLEALLEAFEVLNMALGNSKSAAREQLSTAMDETRELINEAREGSSGYLLLPLRCALNTTARYVDFLREVGGITRDTASDLKDLNRSLGGRMKLLFSDDEEQARPEVRVKTRARPQAAAGRAKAKASPKAKVKPRRKVKASPKAKPKAKAKPGVKAKSAPRAKAKAAPSSAATTPTVH